MANAPPVGVSAWSTSCQRTRGVITQQAPQGPGRQVGQQRIARHAQALLGGDGNGAPRVQLDATDLLAQQHLAAARTDGVHQCLRQLADAAAHVVHPRRGRSTAALP
ncbi:MAG: hypothetical protein IPH72_34720 [Sandaracinaceae bacterium]|nr:hypothetical protein [Sandaracinaceae bacterium]